MEKRQFENEQIKIDFGETEEVDIYLATQDLNYEFTEAMGEGDRVFWVYKPK